VSYFVCGVIFLGRLTSFGQALASFHGFTPLSAEGVDLMVGHFAHVGTDAIYHRRACRLDSAAKGRERAASIFVPMRT
jgi:hypothetical protein